MGKHKYYAVRRGHNPGIYTSWESCNNEVSGFKGCEHKGFSTLQEAEQYVRGISSSASQSLGVIDGGVKAKANSRTEIKSAAIPLALQARHVELVRPSELHASPQEVYQLHFDGASKGNPGRAGAGALLRKADGTVVCELSEGLGVATNNAAEYRGLIVGLKAALERGISRILAKGDSKLVCEQVMQRWKVRNESLRPLWIEAMYLKSQFLEFKIEHVLREFNPEADALANIGVSQPERKFISECPASFRCLMEELCSESAVNKPCRGADEA